MTGMGFEPMLPMGNALARHRLKPLGHPASTCNKFILDIFLVRLNTILREKMHLLKVVFL
jgi:hypothetical protein